MKRGEGGKEIFQNILYKQKESKIKSIYEEQAKKEVE